MNKVNEYLLKGKIYKKANEDDDSIDESTVDDDHATIGVCCKILNSKIINQI